MSTGKTHHIYHRLTFQSFMIDYLPIASGFEKKSLGHGCGAQGLEIILVKKSLVISEDP